MKKFWCWLTGHDWECYDDDVQAVRGEWHLGLFRCTKCGKTSLRRLS